MVSKIKSPKKNIKIAIVGKYFDTGDFVLSDAYISVIEAIKFSSAYLGAKPELVWINSKDYEQNSKKILELKNFDGIIVPGGFGESGIEGIIMAISFARENKMPYLGLCYGMQLAVIEYCRNVIGLKDAHSREVNPKSKNLVIDIMPDQLKKIEEGQMGASMRLGSYTAFVKNKTIADYCYLKWSKDYKKSKDFGQIDERHRHRYEVSLDYIEKIKNAGLVFSGTSEDGTLMEIVELPKEKHPFFLGSQFHPELKARPLSPHPLLQDLLRLF